MRMSSLPDIFSKGSSDSLPHRKQGGPFSLHLSNQSAEKYKPSRAGFAPGDHQYATIATTKRRSVSTASMLPKQSILRD